MVLRASYVALLLGYKITARLMLWPKATTIKKKMVGEFVLLITRKILVRLGKFRASPPDPPPLATPQENQSFSCVKI